MPERKDIGIRQMSHGDFERLKKYAMALYGLGDKVTKLQKEPSSPQEEIITTFDLDEGVIKQDISRHPVAIQGEVIKLAGQVESIANRYKQNGPNKPSWEECVDAIVGIKALIEKIDPVNPILNEI